MIRQIMAGFLIVGGAALCTLGVIGSLQSAYGILKAGEELAKAEQNEKEIAGWSKDQDDVAKTMGHSKQQLGLVAMQSRTLWLTIRAEKIQQLVGSVTALAIASGLIFLGKRIRSKRTEVSVNATPLEGNVEKEEG